MVNVAKIKQILDTELKPEKLGENFEEINENSIKLFQKLFVENLNFDLVRGQFGEIGEEISTGDWSKDAEAEKAFIIAEKEEFRIIYIVVKNLTITRERQSIASLKRKRWAKKGDYICIFFAENSLIWDMVCPHFSEERMILRRYILGDGENHRTVSENLNRMDASDPHPLFERIQQAFKVQVVTEAFFEDYKKAFFTLKIELAHQEIPKKEAHEFTLQLLNRIMFIYFISKKENWLNTKNFMGWLWTEYKKRKKYGTDEFYEIWLKQIFFKAFNNKANEIKDLPKDVTDEILSFPYLNGGLFTPNELDNLKINISDDLFTKIFNFFENYNFTIREDSPIDEEVAVDPQMIGYVYESLANVAEEIYDRHDLGIFYTPRVEVDFMVRKALVEYLSNKYPNTNKENLYHLVFDTSEEKQNISNYFEDEKFWYNLEEILDNLSVVDPACGSGAFLVGMLNVMVELFKLINEHIKVKRDITDFGLKKRIIQYSLYGVDIMPWAIHAAELRLWLQLMVETDLKKEELRQYPLLPNLDLNLRIGDSLVQEIGGLFFNVRTINIDSDSKRRLIQLKEEKRNYFDNLPRAKFKTPEEIREEEIRIFEGLIEKRINKVNEEIDLRKNEIVKAKGQKNLLNKRVYDKEKIKDFNLKIEELKEEIMKLEETKRALDQPEKKPFVWDIDFAEIFGDKNGFDIVIGNPPYVKQEDIAPFNKLKSEVNEKEKKIYKNKLINSVKNHFPVIKKIDGKSDYYIYFYFHGLSLLNENGIFCFITSNSWLDVGYGRNLQEFLLKYVPIIGIYDNPIRSFEHADINTIIALFGAPKFSSERKIAGLRIDRKEDKPTMLANSAKFIMFKKSLEDVINSRNLIEIDKINPKVSNQSLVKLIDNLEQTNDWRVFTIKHNDLLEDGWKYPDSYDATNGRFKKGSYSGNKWGGKFLRAPQIFFTLLDKGKDLFVKLSEVSTIRTGCYSGLNDFFYLTKDDVDKFNIEDDYLTPLIRSSEIISKLKVEDTLGNYVLSVPNKPKSEFKRKGHNNLLKYIEWGENQITRKGQKTDAGIPWNEVASVKTRKFWYSIPENNLLPTNIFMQYISNERFYCPYSIDKLVSDRCFHRIFPEQKLNYLELAASLNSSIQTFFVMLLGRYNLGQGAMKFEAMDAKNVLIFDVRKLDKIKLTNIKNTLKILGNREPVSVFEEIGLNPESSIRSQIPNPKPDRFILDKIFFDELGLTDQEIKEIYYTICELVQGRLIKAKSLK